MVAADIDGDGSLDVLSASVLDNKLAWCRNLGSGTFGSQQVITTAAANPRALVAADLDGDGDVDVVSGHSGGIQLLISLGGGAFSGPMPLSLQTVVAYDLCAADLDGDGDLDMIAAGLSEGKVACYENLGGLTFGPQQDLSTGLNSPVGIDAADLDGDGDLDVLFSAFGQVAWIENLGALSFGSTQTIANDLTPFRAVCAADFDGDGDKDVFSISSVASLQTGWQENLGNGIFAPRQLTMADIAGPRDLDIADADGDGDLDVFIIGSGSWNQVSWLENLGGTFGGLHPIEIGNSPLISGGAAIHTADVDGDGAIDVLTASALDDKISFYQNWSSARTYGIACGVPSLNFAPTSAQGINVPLSGRVAHASPLCVVALGLSRTSMPGVGALPFDLANVGMPGCQLLQSSEVFGLATLPSPNPLLGVIWTATPLPSAANGLHVFAQAFSLAPGANALGVLASNGIDWTVTP